MTQNADRLVPAAPGAPSPEAPDGAPAVATGPAHRETGDVAARTAARTLAARTAGYTSEVRRLLDAGLAVIQRNGTAARPRVADIVATAGLSNDAFYRHFPSKEALVTAVLEDGMGRLMSYVAHQMSKEAEPAGQVRRWVDAVLSQARGEVAASTLAVMWNSSTSGVASGRHPAAGPLSQLLTAPFEALGSQNPQLDAILAAHATLGTLSDYLWRRAEPSEAEVDQIAAFCLRAAAPSEE